MLGNEIIYEKMINEKTTSVVKMILVVSILSNLKD